MSGQHELPRAYSIPTVVGKQLSFLPNTKLYFILKPMPLRALVEMIHPKLFCDDRRELIQLRMSCATSQLIYRDTSTTQSSQQSYDQVTSLSPLSLDDDFYSSCSAEFQETCDSSLGPRPNDDIDVGR